MWYIYTYSLLRILELKKNTYVLYNNIYRTLWIKVIKIKDCNNEEIIYLENAQCDTTYIIYVSFYSISIVQKVHWCLKKIYDLNLRSKFFKYFFKLVHYVKKNYYI